MYKLFFIPFLVFITGYSAASDEISVDLNNLSNVSRVGNEMLSIESEFNGFEINRPLGSVELQGIDWVFYSKDSWESKVNTDAISPLQVIGKFNTENAKSVFSNNFNCSTGVSRNKLAFAGVLTAKGGFSFNVSMLPPGSYRLELYTHNWLSSSDVTACLNTPVGCVTIKNDITFEMTGIKNTIEFITQGLTEELTISYIATPRQFDYQQAQGYHALEAIKITEVK
ncbi:hypothetical protein [Vibrio scophthalmi]|uniref:Uncharacterized protein n=1 Tax=Vibrio scophthalmi LMG 19158 TaxID=870967 RepID=F9RVX4_9VIBR|nr:hypothetical protein [Vibrio scophthalmi]EGU29300.1 hypothetical protein VIS19158_20671 [Vibrio scophthalmi LMG 19158]